MQITNWKTGKYCNLELLQQLLYFFSQWPSWFSFQGIVLLMASNCFTPSYFVNFWRKNVLTVSSVRLNDSKKDTLKFKRRKNALSLSKQSCTCSISLEYSELKKRNRNRQSKKSGWKHHYICCHLIKRQANTVELAILALSCRPRLIAQQNSWTLVGGNERFQIGAIFDTPRRCSTTTLWKTFSSQIWKACALTDATLHPGSTMMRL